jgi:hypothetical protein
MSIWKYKYEALAKLYSQLRSERLELLQKFKAVQPKAAETEYEPERKPKIKKREARVREKHLEEQVKDLILSLEKMVHDIENQIHCSTAS